MHTAHPGAGKQYTAGVGVYSGEYNDCHFITPGALRRGILGWGLLATVLYAQTGWADELADLKARNAQLEATVRELTIQLAAALDAERAAVDARRELEAALAAAQAAPMAAPASTAATSSTSAADVGQTAAIPSEMITEEPIGPPKAAPAPAAASAGAAAAASNNGCNIAEGLAGYRDSGEDNRVLAAWLADSGRLDACSEAELQGLRKAVKWDWLGYQKEVLARIDQELANR